MRVGEKVRVRFIGSNNFIHPMHIHGGPFEIVETDGNPVPAGARLLKDTINVGPGERWDVVWTAVLCADRPPGLPSDPQDDERDREPDQRVAELEAERHDDRAADDSERDESIGACVVAVGDKCRAAEALAGAEADQGGDLVADESDRAGGGECAEVGERLWVDQPLDRLPERDAGADEDRRDNEVAGRLLAAGAAQEEGDPER